MPSFALMYAIDENIEAEKTVKIIGNQWFWEYETTKNWEFVIDGNMAIHAVPKDVKTINTIPDAIDEGRLTRPTAIPKKYIFSSYPVPTAELIPGSPRLSKWINH